MEPIFHFIIPVVFVLAFFPKIDKKIILLFSILTLVPDLDYFIGHRAYFHTLLFVIVVGLIFYFACGKLAGNLSLFYLGSHLLFDMPKLGVPLFWPLTHKLFGFKFMLFTNPGKYLVQAKGEILTKPLIEATKSQAMPVSTEIGIVLTIIFAILLIAIIIDYFKKKPEAKDIKAVETY
jgi:hypothetical protein